MYLQRHCRYYHESDDGIILIATNIRIYELHFYTHEEIKELPAQTFGKVVASRDFLFLGGSKSMIEPIGISWQNAQHDLTQAEHEYEASFGKGTLDRVLYIDPLDLQTESIVEAANLLRHAIKTNTPLEQIPEEMWNGLVF